MGGGKGGSSSQSTSSNPPWLDKAGEDAWNFGKSVYFRPKTTPAASSPSSMPAANSGKGGQSSLTSSIPAANGEKVFSQTRSSASPFPGSVATLGPYGNTVYVNGNGNANGSSGGTSGGAGEFDMSLDNLRPLDQYTGDRVFGFEQSGNLQGAYDNARNSIGISVPYFDKGIS